MLHTASMPNSSVTTQYHTNLSVNRTQRTTEYITLNTDAELVTRTQRTTEYIVLNTDAESVTRTQGTTEYIVLNTDAELVNRRGVSHQNTTHNRIHRAQHGRGVLIFCGSTTLNDVIVYKIRGLPTQGPNLDSNSCLLAYA